MWGRFAGKAKSLYLAAMETYLTVSAKGQITLKKSVLAHLGLKPGQRLTVEMKPGGGIVLRPAPSGRISDVFGMLKRPGQKHLWWREAFAQTRSSGRCGSDGRSIAITSPD